MFSFIIKYHHNFNNGTLGMCKDAVQQRLVSVNLSWLWKSRVKKRRERELNSAQNKLKGRFLILSLFLFRLLLLAYSLRPQTFPVSPVSISSCSTLHTQLVLISGRWWWAGIRMEPLAGKLHTHHGVTNGEKPHQTSSSAAPVHQYISVDVQILCMICGAKSSSLDVKALVFLSNRCSLKCEYFFC